MSEKFRDYVTGGAFSLSLSKRQAEMLSHIHQMGSSFGYLSTYGALEAKGLVERIEPADGEEVNQWTQKVRLTEAGNALVPLLKIAGVYVELPTYPPPAEIPSVKVTIKRKPLEESETPAS